MKRTCTVKRRFAGVYFNEHLYAQLESSVGTNVNFYSQSFVYCRVFVLIIIDYSTKKGELVNSRKCASEIVYVRSNPYRNQWELMC